MGPQVLDQLLTRNQIARCTMSSERLAQANIDSGTHHQSPRTNPTAGAIPTTKRGAADERRATLPFGAVA